MAGVAPHRVVRVHRIAVGTSALLSFVGRVVRQRLHYAAAVRSIAGTLAVLRLGRNLVAARLDARRRAVGDALRLLVSHWWLLVIHSVVGVSLILLSVAVTIGTIAVTVVVAARLWLVVVVRLWCRRLVLIVRDLLVTGGRCSVSSTSRATIAFAVRAASARVAGISTAIRWAVNGGTLERRTSMES